MNIILYHTEKLYQQCKRFYIAEENPVFYNRLMFYLDVLLSWEEDADVEDPVLPYDIDEVLHAIQETNTIITLDEDLDGAGLEHMMELWESALDITYGEDYSYNEPSDCLSQ